MQQSNIQIKEVQFSNAELLPEIMKLINEGHTVTLRLKGFSMRPFLENDRDKALLTKPEDIKVGLPVLARISTGTYVLHRIVGIDGDNITLLGDGNLTTESCLKKDIEAQAIGFYRKGSNKLDSIYSAKWKAYSILWTSLRPIRRYLLFIYRHLPKRLYYQSPNNTLEEENIIRHIFIKQKMKKKTGFNLRTVCGEKIIVAEGKENIDFSNIIALNESAAYLWEKAADKEFTAEDMVKWLTEEYEIDEETARRDANTLATQWIEAGIVNA